MPLLDLPSLQTDPFQRAALPGSGDTNPGSGGITTSALTNQTVLDTYGVGYEPMVAHGKHLAPGLAGNPIAEHPFWTVAIIGGALLAYKFYGSRDTELDKLISVRGGLVVGGIATLVILMEKWFFSTIQLPSITPTMEYL